MTQRIDRIRHLLQSLSPTLLEIQDDSAAHAGHAGAAGGAGHFSVRIETTVFAGKNRISRHRLVYDALRPMLPAEIHALVIHATAPGENPAGNSGS